MARLRVFKLAALLIALVFLSTACATFPREGPTQPALIGAGKTVAQYDADDASCRQLASQRTGVSPGEAMEQSQLKSAALGLLGAGLGAGLGAALGGGRGAAIGAAGGGALGITSGIGAGAAMGGSSASMAQQRYNSEYYACMYARGHQVPGAPAPAAYPQPQPAYTPPPPPPYGGPQPGAMPPPPPPTGYQQPATPPGPPPAATAPAPPQAGAAPCKPTGKYVKTTQGLVPECE